MEIPVLIPCCDELATIREVVEPCVLFFSHMLGKWVWLLCNAAMAANACPGDCL